MLCDSLHAKFLTQSWFDNCAAFFIACRWVGRQTLKTDDDPDIKLFILVGWDRASCCCLAHRGLTGVFLLLGISVSYMVPRDLHRLTAN